MRRVGWEGKEGALEATLTTHAFELNNNFMRGKGKAPGNQSSVALMIHSQQVQLLLDQVGAVEPRDQPWIQV